MTPETEIAKALGVKEILPEVYQDLLKPTTQLAGQKLYVVANALCKAFDTLEGAVWGYDRIKDWMCSKVLEKFAGEDPANIQSPKLSIAGPIIMNMHFAYEEEHLKEMYANLLAAAMHKKKADSVHPSYVHVLQQLSPDEALILEYVKNHEEGREAVFRGQYFGYPNEIIRKLYGEVCREGAVDSNQCHKYLDNLIRLRFFTIRNAIGIECERKIGSMSDIDDLEAYSYEMDLMLTDFGWDFIYTCID
ncbi:DUF4393 domain-containing protein [Planctomycetota bacterium]|nr:DUF4393 domain-containing protein [Planctomycetota bacterium]